MNRDTYLAAGVDRDAAQAAKESIIGIASKTLQKEVVGGVGFFGGMYELQGYNRPVLVSSTDSPGTKLRIANLTGRFDTVGVDLVNHCVNDILVIGAKPLFFLDYFATGKLSIETVEKVVEGLAIACKENSAVLIGGETAEMPDFYQEGEYDISGTIIGVVDKKYMMPIRKTNKGDLLVGLPSTGLHTNGYSLARKALLERYHVDRYFEELDMTLGQSLLSVHKSYLPALDAILEKDWLHGISHITGGGMVENTHRVIEKGQDIDVNWDTWSWPEIFNLIQKYGEVPIDDMRRSFNLGMGLVLIINPASLDELSDHLSSINEEFTVIGKVV